VACEEGTVLEALVQEKMAKTLVLMGVIGASMSPRTYVSPGASGAQANDTRPQSIGVPRA
jgi:hypothetical protein